MSDGSSLSLSLQLVLVQCGGDESSARVWSSLQELDLSVNAIDTLDVSLVSVCVCVRVCAYVCVCVRVHVSVCECVCVCVCVWMDGWRDLAFALCVCMCACVFRVWCVCEDNECL